MLFRSTLFLTLLAAASAYDLGFLRGYDQQPLDQFACTLSGGSDQETCDATKSEDGTKCVWCTIATFGACVSEDIAEKMKAQIPGLECDDDDDDDAVTDDGAADDDKAPITDDTTPNDDSTPDDYWNCIKKHSNSTDCTSAGCAWCDTSGGFGICMDKEAAESASKSDWFDCKMPDTFFVEEVTYTDPYDPSCIAVTLQGDESSCKATQDADGQACEWCSVGSTELCLDGDQAQIAEQIGGSCDENFEDSKKLMDPYDPTCIAVTLQGDESSCESTLDADGEGCQWCSVGTTELCLNGEQAGIAEQIGGSCVDKSPLGKFKDPYDPSCITVSLSGDESHCTDTRDSDGRICAWCTIGTSNLCLNGDQAQIAEQVGASCAKDNLNENVVDPYDPTCIAVTLQGDESSCKATMDADGNACEWCSVGTTELCLDVDQAQIAEQIGGSCDDFKEQEGLMSVMF